MELVEHFNNFKNIYSEVLSGLDGLNGDCSIYSLLLFKYFKSINILAEIYMLNKGIHFWVKVGNCYLDCRGVFYDSAKVINSFMKFIVKPRIQIVSYDFLYSYVLKNKPSKGIIFSI